MSLKPSTLLYIEGERIRNEEAAKNKRPLPESLREPPPISRPQGRIPEQEEIEGMFNAMMQTTKWFAFTHRNVDLVCKVFLNDHRIPLTRNINDFVKAVEIADGLFRLDKQAPPRPPPKPKFEDSIDPWQLKMPSPEYVLRKADKRQLQDYIERAKRYEKWLAEQEQEPT